MLNQNDGHDITEELPYCVPTRPPWACGGGRHTALGALKPRDTRDANTRTARCETVESVVLGPLTGGPHVACRF